MQYRRMPIEIEAPEGFGYDKIDYNLSESSFTDQRLRDLGISVDDLLLCYSDHMGKVELRDVIAREVSLTAEDVLDHFRGSSRTLYCRDYFSEEG